MAKEITFDDMARRGMLKGVNLLADTVKLTLGPRVATSFCRRALALRRLPRTV